MTTINGSGPSDAISTELPMLTGKRVPPQPESKPGKEDGYDSASSAELDIRQNGPARLLSTPGGQFATALDEGEIMTVLRRMPEGSDRTDLTRLFAASKREPERYSFFKIGDPETKQVRSTLADLFHEDPEQTALKSFDQLLNDKETRELARVAAAMVFSVSNPIAAISALGNLLSGLETAAAKSVAADDISDVSSFAARQALIAAKYDPKSNEGSKLLSALKSIVVAVCNQTCSEAGQADGESADADLNPEAGGVPSGSVNPEGVSLEEGEQVVVVDNYTGEVFVAEDCCKDGIDACEASCSASEEATGDVLTAQDSAGEAAYQEKQIESNLVKSERKTGAEKASQALDEIKTLTGEIVKLERTGSTEDKSKITVLEGQIEALKPRTIFIA